MHGMALTRPSLTMQLTSGVDVFAHVCGKKADTSSNYCDNRVTYDKKCFSFVRCDTIFRLFFLNYHKFELLINFRKVVRQHTKGMVGSIIRFFVIFLSFQQGNNFENQLRIDKVIAMSLAY